MSDLRDRLIDAIPQLGLTDYQRSTAVDALLPIVEAELTELEQIWKDAIGHIKAAHQGEIERLKGGTT